MKEPEKRKDGSCSACVGGWLCEYHQAENARLWKEKQAMLKSVAVGIRQSNAERLAAHLELESDEAGTATEKAKRILAGVNPIPRHLMISGV